MSSKSTTGSAAPSVQKWVIDSDVENQLRSFALLRRIRDESLSYGSIELYLRCSNFTVVVLEDKYPFSLCPSLLRVDLSGCLKLERIPEKAFGNCHHLESVVFGKHSNITNLGVAAFQECYALTSITLPDKLEIIETRVFTHC